MPAIRSERQINRWPPAAGTPVGGHLGQVCQQARRCLERSGFPLAPLGLAAVPRASARPADPPPSRLASHRCARPASGLISSHGANLTLAGTFRPQQVSALVERSIGPPFGGQNNGRRMQTGCGELPPRPQRPARQVAGGRWSARRPARLLAWPDPPADKPQLAGRPDGQQVVGAHARGRRHARRACAWPKVFRSRNKWPSPGPQSPTASEAQQVAAAKTGTGSTCCP